MGLLNLTESERLEILNLHNNARIIKEAIVAPPVVGTPQPPMDDKAKIMAIQTALKTKYKSELGTSGPNKDGIDGTLGTKTLAAISNVMKSKGTPPASEVKPVATAVVPATSEVKPVATAVVPATSEVKPETTVVQAAPQSNRDQRRERQDLRRSNRRDMQNLRAGQQGQQQ